MAEVTEMGNQSLPSIINDPFKKNSIVSLSVRAYENWKRDGFNFTGYVEFRNGNTKGQQDFEGASFDEVVLKIKAMLEDLK